MAERQEQTLSSSVRKLREGTEVLRTGGGATLNASECNAVLDVIETARYLGLCYFCGRQATETAKFHFDHPQPRLAVCEKHARQLEGRRD